MLHAGAAQPGPGNTASVPSCSSGAAYKQPSRQPSGWQGGFSVFLSPPCGKLLCAAAGCGLHMAPQEKTPQYACPPAAGPSFPYSHRSFAAHKRGAASERRGKWKAPGRSRKLREMNLPAIQTVLPESMRAG